MNAEGVNSVDFSGSVPNPYIGKVRRRVTMNTDMNNENGKVVTDEMIADWESALERDEWPNGWVNVGEIVEGKLMKAAPDTCAGADDAAEQEDAEGDRGREKERLLMEFRLANGTVITDEDIERECAEYESGSWTGTLTRLRVGRPRLSDGEGNANLSFKCPKTGADLIERAAAACGMHKSEFLRSAAIEKAEKILKSA